jgi:hypothetical protein
MVTDVDEELGQNRSGQEARQAGLGGSRCREVAAGYSVPSRSKRPVTATIIHRDNMPCLRAA